MNEKDEAIEQELFYTTMDLTWAVFPGCNKVTVPIKIMANQGKLKAYLTVMKLAQSRMEELYSVSRHYYLQQSLCNAMKKGRICFKNPDYSIVDLAKPVTHLYMTDRYSKFEKWDNNDFEELFVFASNMIDAIEKQLYDSPYDLAKAIVDKYIEEKKVKALIAKEKERPKDSVIKVVYCEPGKLAEIKEIPKDIHTMTDLVGGGGIDLIYPFREKGITLVCNEYFRDLEPNRVLPEAECYPRDFVYCGPFFICGSTYDEYGTDDYGSLTDEQAERYRRMLDSLDAFRC